MLNDDEGPTRPGPRQWIAKLADRLHAAEDTRARRRGWQVSRISRGLGREYRDPRWDLIVACEVCGGEGMHGVHRCADCLGRGTVQLVPVDLHPGGMS
jgi:hypothetical protein